MGFYDQPDFQKSSDPNKPESTEHNHVIEPKLNELTPYSIHTTSDEYKSYPSSQPPKQRKTTILVALTSAIVGGLIVLASTPFLLRSGLFDQAGNMNPSYSGPVQSTSVKVNSQITDAVSKVQNAVVGIENIGESNDPFNPDTYKQGTGSGIIFEKNATTNKALVVTNNHVIEGSKIVRVNVPVGDNKSKPVTAKVLGTDAITDLAVLEIDASQVKTVAKFGNSDIIKAGEPAIAIGNPLGPQFSQSVTVGVISSARRTIEVSKGMSTDVIQTDAAINPGNSGGALVNAAGQVIGINSLKIAEQGVEGLGFAIPSNEARPLIDALIQYGKVPRPYLGVSLIDLNDLPPSVWRDLQLPSDVETGTVIRSAEPGTPAKKAGLQSKDVIVALDDVPVATSSELRSYLYKKKKIGSPVKVTFYRNGNKQTATVALEKSPE